MDISLFILLLTTLCAAIIKNHIVYKAHTKALGIVSARARRAIELGDSKWDRFYSKMYSCGSYNAHFCDLFKWTFKQMFGDLEENLESS